LEELRSQENEFAAKRGDWYQKNLMLNYSGLMDDAEFGTKVWNVMHEELSSNFSSDISTLLWAMKGFLEDYVSFEGVSKRLDDLLANEKNRVPEGWKSYKVVYDELGCAVPQEFYCYAPDTNKAKELLYKVMEEDVIKVIEIKEDEL